jgi:hypothetical protein
MRVLTAAPRRLGVNGFPPKTAEETAGRHAGAGGNFLAFRIPAKRRVTRVASGRLRTASRPTPAASSNGETS